MNPRYKIGMRTVKTVVAVGICLLVFQFFMPNSSINGIQAALAATICMKSSLQNTIRTGLDRAAGTVVGSVMGVLFLLLSSLLPAPLISAIGIFGVLLIIYLCNVFRLQASVTISIVVFLIILIGVERDIPPVFYGLARLGETIFGIFIAYMVNRFLDLRHFKKKEPNSAEMGEPHELIREAADDDLGAIMHIWLQANIAAHPFIDALYWHKRYDAVRTDIKQAQTAVYENRGEIQGFVSLSTEAEVIALCVAAHAQHRGIGNHLTDHAKQLLPCLGVKCFKKNERSVKFLLNRGFVPTLEQYNAEAGCPEYTMEWSAKNKTCPSALPPSIESQLN
jgi:ribosomal protein S18 acetylase RimI-like enzyme